MKVIKGKKAKEILRQLLYYGEHKLKYTPYCKGYFKCRSCYVAFDNQTGDCWVEEFRNRLQAMIWLEASSPRRAS
jgi:hypothetical protein